ncbi:hypothetical protein R1flu_019052 [Riccia fluitans]|uniref:Uncharacterized protein n=1 Tax=Riccia fluitans TaxID=41844 RepID=A0ABD1ZHK6_9MARC
MIRAKGMRDAAVDKEKIRGSLPLLLCRSTQNLECIQRSTWAVVSVACLGEAAILRRRIEEDAISFVADSAVAFAAAEAGVNVDPAAVCCYKIKNEAAAGVAWFLQNMAFTPEFALTVEGQILEPLIQRS